MRAKGNEAVEKKKRMVREGRKLEKGIIMLKKKREGSLYANIIVKLHFLHVQFVAQCWVYI